MTAYHFLVLYCDRLLVMSRISGEVLLNLPLNDLGLGSMRGLVHDAAKNELWAFSERQIFRINVDREERDVWRLLLEKAKRGNNGAAFEEALTHCSEPYQMDAVHNAYGDFSLARGQLQHAARIFAQGRRSFEEVALMFVELSNRGGAAGAEGQAALHSFLRHKLYTLRKEDETQKTLLCTWLTELYLDRFNRLQQLDHVAQDSAGAASDDLGGDRGRNTVVQVGAAVDRAAELVYEFRQFLEENKAHLDKPTTFKLISSHGREEEGLLFARLIKDYERVVAFHLQRAQFRDAITELQEAPFAAVEKLYYKFSSQLMDGEPAMTVRCWQRAERLNPCKLLPALVRYGQKRAASGHHGGEDYAMTYLQHCVLERGALDPALHNYLLSLYARLQDEQPLLAFVTAKSEKRFDRKYALRVCMRATPPKLRSCVYIYSMMGLYEEAVELALSVDVQLAKENASKPTDAALRKRLWLAVARHTIDNGHGLQIKGAIALLNECDGLLGIEDVLPFFPDFVVIDDFKNEICQSLEVCNGKIAGLKSEMEELTDGAAAIRRDMDQLKLRSRAVSTSQRCCGCDRLLLTRPFLLFPCSHAFHETCLVDEILPHLSAAERLTVKQLQTDIANLSSSQGGASSNKNSSSSHHHSGAHHGGHGATLGGTVTGRATASAQAAAAALRERLRSQLDGLVANECALCGDAMIRSIGRPFTDDPAEVEAWAL